MPSYKLVPEPNTTQTPEDRSFKGGLANMPDRIPWPTCLECGIDLAFFFQVEFPQKHVYRGWVMCMFQCIECADPTPAFFYLTPVSAEEKALLGIKSKRLNTIKKLSEYELDIDQFQFKFRTILFRSSEASVVRTSARQHIKFERIRFDPLPPNNRFLVSKVGGKAGWWFENEPGEHDEVWYAGEKLTFLMSIADWTFPAVEGAPVPKDVLSANLFSIDRAYRLFQGKAVYFQGTTSSKYDPPRILVVSQ